MEMDWTECRVLVADDEETVARALAADVSRRLGCRVEAVFDGDQALEALSRELFDLLITDMVMPGCHGLELVKRVVDEHPEVSVLVTTAFPGEFPFVDVVRAGAEDFVVKPHPPQELQAKVIRIFRERALRRELKAEKERILSDMRAMQRLRDERAAAEFKYRNLFEYSMNGMLVVAPDTYAIRDANHSFCATTIFGRNELVDRSLLDLFEEVERQRLVQGVAIVAELGKATLGDMMLTCKDGATVCLDVSIARIRVEPEDMVLVVCQDVTEQREMQRKLAEIAQTDALTGLLNKRSFSARLDATVNRARREEQRLTLLFLDVDNFKHCNDTFGHQAGDDLLTALGQMILKHTRTRQDMAFRYGGDEFAILLYQADEKAGSRVAGRIAEEFLSRETHGTSLSVGVCGYNREMSPSDFLKSADQALYRAKQAGKNQICVA